MTMTYTELKTNIADIVENSFTTEQLNLFIQQTEQKIYGAVQFPALRKNVEGSTTTGNKYLQTPSDILYVYSLAVVSNSDFVYLLNKDVNFIREAYPNPTTTGVPKHYGYFTFCVFHFTLLQGLLLSLLMLQLTFVVPLLHLLKLGQTFHIAMIYSSHLMFQK